MDWTKLPLAALAVLSSWAVVVTAQAQNAIGAWRVTATHSQLESRTDAVATVSSTNLISDGAGGGRNATLILRCRGPKDNAFYIDWPQAVAGPFTEVRYSIDGLKTEKQRWDVSSSGNAVGTFSSRKAIQVMTRFKTASKLVVEVTPRNSTPQEAVFDLRGASAAIEAMAEACVNGRLPDHTG